MNSPREHDQPLEQLLRQSLKTPRRAGVTDLCLDAETLAAWTDGGLSGAALEEARLHVTDCARCQDLVGTLARLNSDAAVPEPARTSRRWLAWAVPLTAAAAAVALWFAIPDRNALVSPPTRDELQVKENDKASAPGSAQPAPPSGDGREMFSAREVLPTPGVPESGRPAIGGAHQSPDAPEARQRIDAAKQSTGAADTASKDVAEAAAKDANDKGKEEAASNSVAGRLESSELKKAVTPTAPVPAEAATAASPPPAAERTAGRARSLARAADVGATEILSPDLAVRWRILGAAVQHSANGGSTWEAASTGVAAELTAGAAPATTVCWLVGRGGVVLLTTDGRTWRRVAFPEMTDLSGIFTVDAGGNVASASTADGRTFVTTDGGATWVSR